MRNLIFIAIILSILAGCGEANLLTGKVLGPSGEPADGVKVSIKDSKPEIATTTDKEGKYSLTYKPGDLELVFSHSMCLPQSVKIDAKGGKMAVQQVKIFPNPVIERKFNEMREESKQIATGIICFSGKNKTFPLADENKNAEYKNKASALNPLLSGKYVDGRIGEDPYGNEYSYWVPSKEQAKQGYPAVLYSNGPNGINESWNPKLWKANKFGGDDWGKIMGNPWPK